MSAKTSKIRIAVALMALVIVGEMAFGQSNPARKYHDAEKEQAILLTQIAVDTSHGVWALRNESGWFLKSVSFQCDTNESSGEHFLYLRSDGSLIPPWKDRRTPRGKNDPWGVAVPGDDEVVRHVSGVRQDLLDLPSTEWYIKRLRLFNCQTTDVDMDHRQPKKAGR